MRHVAAIALVVLTAACGQVPFLDRMQDDPAPVATSGDVQPTADQTRPQSRPAPAAGGARTAEALDQSTAQDRAAAAAPPSGGESRIGETVASLGDVARQGFWLETPLVDAPTEGRIVYPGTGKSARVQLRPIPGPDGAGSRISLSAMRQIGAPLTDLPRLEVYRAG